MPRNYPKFANRRQRDELMIDSTLDDVNFQFHLTGDMFNNEGSRCITVCSGYELWIMIFNIRKSSHSTNSKADNIFSSSFYFY